MKKEILVSAIGLILIFTGGFSAFAEYENDIYYSEDYSNYEGNYSYNDVNTYDSTESTGYEYEVVTEVTEQTSEAVQESTTDLVSLEPAITEEAQTEQSSEEKLASEEGTEKKEKKSKKKKEKEKSSLALPPAKDGDVMCDTLREAKTVAGFRLAAPRSLSGYMVRGIYAHEGMVEVCYLGEKGEMLSFFKSTVPIEVGAEIYQDEKAYDIDNIWLTMSGEKPTYYKAFWEEDGYYFVILSSEGMTDAIIEEYFDEIA